LKQSTQKAAEFENLSKALNGKKLVMVADVSTRWNSTFAMLERAYQIRETIRIFCQRNSLSEKYNLSEYEWQKVQQLCVFLEPLYKATKTMSSSNYVSMMLAAPVYKWLIEAVDKVNSQAVPSHYPDSSTDILLQFMNIRHD
jgi:CRISPR/Cas system-associated protein Cas5 (RAMP superfamily)